ncbi:MAG: protein kinase [Deltaproteobacteria bacterium]|nr:MAG: protein kinase [Deltaproteobacteria bacterium]
MIDGLLAGILARHGAELSAACRAELAAAMESLAAPSVQLESIAASATVDWEDETTSQQTWTGYEDQTTARRTMLPERYEDLGLLGFGGMGQVRRVRDLRLGREVALKLIRLDAKPEDLARFTREAEITAGLQHPGVVPVYDYGTLGNGAPYYTMPVLGGRHMGEAIARVHQASGPGGFGTSWDGMGLRKLVIAFLSAAEAVAYAHSHGVIHRDLKPENIMLGEFGETLVVDWGLAREADETGKTGRISGTPAYMAPEQARGEPESLRTDVYGLGAVLYEVLSGRPPYRGSSAQEVVELVGRQGPLPVTQVAVTKLPEELVELCEWAMQREVRERPASAREVATAAASWLDGARRLDQAMKLVAESEGRFSEVAAARSLAGARDVERQARAKEVGPHGALEDKRAVWRLEDEVRSLRNRAALDEQRGLQALRSALIQVPELPEARRRLAKYYRARHEQAERDRDFTGAATMELLLREHDRGEHRRYLAGMGAVSLCTDPPGASVEVLRYVERDRRLQLESTGRVHKTPIQALELPIGSYLLRIRAEGRQVVDYPVRIDREQHWSGVDPEGVAVPIALPREGRLAGGVYVPAGWTWVGGDPQAPGAVERMRLWCDAFVVDRHHITNARYIGFLEELVRQGREESALDLAPRERGEAMVYGFEGGHFFLRPDADGDLWQADWPVIMVTLHGAQAYAAWCSDRDSLPWRLPGEIEWEKAARGVDGRFFPWGDQEDVTFANGRDARPQGAGPEVVDAFPVDESVYGMRHASGNAFEWCAEPYQRHPAWHDGERYRVPTSVSVEEGVAWSARGGDWYCVPRQSRLARRIRLLDPSYRSGGLSFRLARNLVPSRDC